VKSFFAKSIQDAMSRARVEMGPDALLLDTKPAPPEARHLGEYEVVFGEYADEMPAQASDLDSVPESAQPPAQASVPPPAKVSAPPPAQMSAQPYAQPYAPPPAQMSAHPHVQPSSQPPAHPSAQPPAQMFAQPPAKAPMQVAARGPVPVEDPDPEDVPSRPLKLNAFSGVRRSVEEIRSLLGGNADEALSGPASHRHAQRVAGMLVKAEVDPELALDIAEAVRARMHRRSVLDISRPRSAAEWDESSLVLETQAEMAARCPVQSTIGPVTALVGPPGAGKTTTLVKLAVSQGLAAGRAVRLVSVDTQRIGAAAQLETYAAILDVPFQVVDSPAALAQVIDYAPANTLLLIDTPGYSASLFEELGCDLANLLARRQEIDTHLVLTASMRPEALRQAADLYGAFRPSKLLFTHLDEATPYAAMFCEAARRELALSFFATGQSVPEDLEPAAVRRITDSLVWQLPKAMQAIA
jgi:flagellar biosynthesis protein FlhF